MAVEVKYFEVAEEVCNLARPLKTNCFLLWLRGRWGQRHIGYNLRSTRTWSVLLENIDRSPFKQLIFLLQSVSWQIGLFLYSWSYDYSKKVSGVKATILLCFSRFFSRFATWKRRWGLRCSSTKRFKFATAVFWHNDWSGHRPRWTERHHSRGWKIPPILHH